jgi:hypothetical protein
MIFRSRKDEGMAHDTAAPFVEAPVGTPLQASRRSLLLGAAAAAVTSILSASATEAAMDAATGPEIAAAEREWLERWKRGPTRVRWTSLPVQSGDKAPDLELADSSGSIVRLGDTWHRVAVSLALRPGPARVRSLRIAGRPPGSLRALDISASPRCEGGDATRAREAYPVFAQAGVRLACSLAARRLAVGTACAKKRLRPGHR